MALYLTSSQLVHRILIHGLQLGFDGAAQLHDRALHYSLNLLHQDVGVWTNSRLDSIEVLLLTADGNGHVPHLLSQAVEILSDSIDHADKLLEASG